MIVYSGCYSPKSIEGDVAQIKEAISPFLIHEFKEWRSNEVAFLQRNNSFTPESILSQLPLTKERLAITGDIRLDNRSELAASLNISSALARQMCDAQFVLAAYQKWEENCSVQLLGDFAFAIWDEKKRQLFCSRDHFGIKPFLYYWNEDKFVFSSAVDPMMKVMDTKAKVNIHKFSTLLFNHPINEPREEHWCQNIFHLAAGSSIVVNPSGLHKKKYWIPTLVKELSFKSDAHFIEEFQELFFRVVEDRLRSNFPVSALLSGGLDSASIVAVAAKILEKQNKELHTFSSVLPDANDPVLKDERLFIDRFKLYPNVNMHYITAPGKGFFSDLDFLENNVITPNIHSRHFLYNEFIRTAQSLNSKVILDGAGGEFGPTTHGTGVYADLFWQGHWQLLFKELNAQKKYSGRSVSRNFYSEILRPRLSSILRAFKKQRNNGIHFGEHCLQQNIFSLLEDSVTGLTNDVSKPSSKKHLPHVQQQLQMLLTLQNKAQGSPIRGGVEFRFPFKDKRLLEFCLGVPLHFKVRNGFKRSMIRIGLDKILPPEIQWGNCHLPLSPDYMRRFKAQVAEVKLFLNTISKDDPIRKIVDIEKMKSWTNISVRDNEKGTFEATVAMQLLPEGIFLIYFLRHFEEFKNK